MKITKQIELYFSPSEVRDIIEKHIKNEIAYRDSVLTITFDVGEGRSLCFEGDAVFNGVKCTYTEK